MARARGQIVPRTWVSVRVTVSPTLRQEGTRNATADLSPSPFVDALQRALKAPLCHIFSSVRFLNCTLQTRTVTALDPLFERTLTFSSARIEGELFYALGRQLGFRVYIAGMALADSAVFLPSQSCTGSTTDPLSFVCYLVRVAGSVLQSKLPGP